MIDTLASSTPELTPADALAAPPAGTPPPGRARGRLTLPRVTGRDWPKHAIILAVMVFELLPLYMMLQISFKDNFMFSANPWLPASPSQWHWENWRAGLALVLPYAANTVFVAAWGTVGALGLALLGAYFFARYRLPGSGVLWGALLVLMLMPGVANIVPLFNLLKSLHLLNTLWALVTLAVAGGQVFNVYLLRNFIEDIPRDLFEAAEVDGASHLQQLRHVVVPLSAPILGTLAILSLLGTWNDFLLPLILLRDPGSFTLGAGLIYLDGEYDKQWGRIMATFFLASVPLLLIFLFTMKLFVRGLSSGAVKG